MADRPRVPALSLTDAVICQACRRPTTVGRLAAGVVLCARGAPMWSVSTPAERVAGPDGVEVRR